MNILLFFYLTKQITMEDNGEIQETIMSIK